MARPSKLTAAQCEKARLLRAEGVPVPKLAKRFKVSESSMYKVMDGSYTTRKNCDSNESLFTPLVELAPMAGVTPSVFKPQRSQFKNPSKDELVEKAASMYEIDDLTLAAAELIVARAHYARALSHQH